MLFTEKDNHCREIITKAVCGKGRKFSQATHTVTPSHSPTSILGCWIINHSFESEQVDEAVEINGTYDINVWYSHNNNTKTEVATESVSYVDHVPLTMLDKNCLDSRLQVHAQASQQPTASEATISDSGHAVLIQVEREFIVEVIGETKVCVLVCPSACDDLDDKDFSFDNEGLDQEFDDLDPDIIIDDLD